MCSMQPALQLCPPTSPFLVHNAPMSKSRHVCQRTAFRFHAQRHRALLCSGSNAGESGTAPPPPGPPSSASGSSSHSCLPSSTTSTKRRWSARAGGRCERVCMVYVCHLQAWIQCTLGYALLAAFLSKRVRARHKLKVKRVQLCPARSGMAKPIFTW